MSQPIEWQHVTGEWRITDYDSRDDADALPEQMPLKGTVTFRARFDSHERFAAINVPDPAGSYLLSMREMVYPVIHGRLQDRQARDGVMLPATAGGVPIVWEATPALETDPGVFTKGVEVRADKVTFLPPAKDASGERHINLSDVFDTTISLPPIVESRVAELVRQATEANTRAHQDAEASAGSAAFAQRQAEAAEEFARQTAEMIPPATATQLGKLKLRGDLGGTAEDPKVPALAQKADLDANGKVVQAQIPAIAMTDHLGAVNSQAAMLALVGQRGDWCIRTDRGSVWVITAEPSSQIASWVEWVYPTSPVQSVNGRTGAVTTSAGDITDSGAVGRSVMRAADEPAARGAIGAAAKPTERGAWAATTAYTEGDVVTAAYARWYCKTGHTSGAAFAEVNWIHLGLYAVGAASDPGVPGRLWVKI